MVTPTGVGGQETRGIIGRPRQLTTTSGLLGAAPRRKPAADLVMTSILASNPDTPAYPLVQYRHQVHQDCGVPSEGRNRQQ